MDDGCRLHTFCEKCVATGVAACALSEEWKGDVVPVRGGNDKRGFPMKQSVLTCGRVHLLLNKGHSCYRTRRTKGRKHSSVYWMHCACQSECSRLGYCLKKIFSLSKEDDVHQHVVRQPLNNIRSPGPKQPRISFLLFLVSCNTNANTLL